MRDPEQIQDDCDCGAPLEGGCPRCNRKKPCPECNHLGTCGSEDCGCCLEPGAEEEDDVAV